MLFVDTGVADVDELVASIDPDIEVVMLDAGSDGVQQMADYLSGRSGIEAIHILSHGNQALLQLGSATLSLESMGGAHTDALEAIGLSLSEDADILIYGCDFGEGASGQMAALQLGLLTGADVAVSDDLTGGGGIGWRLGS